MSEITNIDEVVESYGHKDEELKLLKKSCDADKEYIKNYLANLGEDKYSAGGYTVQRVVSERETLNEDRLLPILKSYWITTHGSMDCPYIKTKEYIDMDKLEEAIYQKELTPSILLEMDKCREVTTVISLKCKKAKEDK